MTRDEEIEHKFTALLDHTVYLCDQLGRLKAMLIAQGIHVPQDLGELGGCPEESYEVIVARAMARLPEVPDEETDTQ